MLPYIAASWILWDMFHTISNGLPKNFLAERWPRHGGATRVFHGLVPMLNGIANMGPKIGDGPVIKNGQKNHNGEIYGNI